LERAWDLSTSDARADPEPQGGVVWGLIKLKGALVIGKMKAGLEWELRAASWIPGSPASLQLGWGGVMW